MHHFISVATMVFFLTSSLFAEVAPSPKSSPKEQTASDDEAVSKEDAEDLENKLNPRPKQSPADQKTDAFSKGAFAVLAALVCAGGIIATKVSKGRRA